MYSLVLYQEADEAFLAEIATMAEAVADYLAPPAPAPSVDSSEVFREVRLIGESLLRASLLESPREVTPGELVEACRKAAAAIRDVVVAGGEGEGEEENEEGKGLFGAYGPRKAALARALPSPRSAGHSCQDNTYSVERLWEDVEAGCRGRVRRKHIVAEMTALEEAALDLEVLLREDFAPAFHLSSARAPGAKASKTKVQAQQSVEDVAIWLKGGKEPMEQINRCLAEPPAESDPPWLSSAKERARVWLASASASASAAAAEAEAAPVTPRKRGGVAGRAAVPHPTPSSDSFYIHPVDRKNQRVYDRYSTARVEAALGLYRKCAESVRVSVVRHLKALSVALQPQLDHPVVAANFAVVAQAMQLHARESIRREWVMPELLPAPGDAGRPEEDPIHAPFRLRGLWLYWLTISSRDTVPNDVDVDSMLLLTGPNAGGKSTLQRSIAAAGLLANCGLSVPARAASVPWLTSIVLRMAGGDSPSEGISSYAAEMAEVASILRDAGPGTLVLVDELGRGTEPLAGTALAASVLESLDAAGCRGIFSTHHHSLLDLRLRTKRTRKVCMEVVEAAAADAAAEAAGGQTSTRQLRPTWKLVEGESRESLAMEVARKHHVPLSVVARAEEHYAKLAEAGRAASEHLARSVKEEEEEEEELSSREPVEEARFIGAEADGASPPKAAAGRRRAKKGAASASSPLDHSHSLEDAAAVLRETASRILAQSDEMPAGASGDVEPGEAVGAPAVSGQPQGSPPPQVRP